jgi:NIMA (never in mitosis gene a)-related kinase
LPALVVKILRGNYPPIPQQYSQELAQLIDAMLQRRPEDRPAVGEILALPFIRSRMEQFFDSTQRAADACVHVPGRWRWAAG